MKKYLVVISHETADGIASAMVSYDNLNEAESRMHSELASALVSYNVKSAMISVIDTDGYPHHIEKVKGLYVDPVVGENLGLSDSERNI